MIMTPPDEPRSDGEKQGPGRSDAAAPWDRIAFAAPAGWVEETIYDATVPPQEGAHVTILRWERQAEADLGASFHATALRLETAVAVQNQSQWSLNLDPRFHHLTLHWLRVVRGGERFDQVRRDRMRLLQRETQLEHHVINGGWTLLAVLDDVRPGDTIEAAYTFVSRHPISEGWSETFFSVPGNLVVGNFRLSLLFDPAGREMRWKGSDDAPALRETRDAGGKTRWLWEGNQLKRREMEPNLPSTFLNFIWIQASDVPDWNHLVRRVSEAWAGNQGNDLLGSNAEFARPNDLGAAAVTCLVRRIQDEFRYLSIDLDTGGWIPAPPDTVARQRRGDCKDLVWLATSILRRWGVRARPVLVGSGFCETVAAFLPSTLLFNHAVLEVDIDGASRWFDMTLRNQGGDFAGQPVKWFGMGLPVDAGADGPVAQPGQRAPSLIAVRETIYLDTRPDETSAVDIVLRAEGHYAEYYRRNHALKGAGEFAEERLGAAQKRYGKAKRTGTLQVRDDRESNVFEFAEGFHMTGAVYAGEGGKRALYDVPLSLVFSTLAIPEEKTRRGPWAMPFPLEIRHTLTVKSKGMGKGAVVRNKWSTPEFTALLEEPRFREEWSKTVRLVVMQPEIAADRVAAFREQMMDLRKALSWRIYLAWGQMRPDLLRRIGELPPPEQGIRAYVGPDDPKTYPSAVIGASRTGYVPPSTGATIGRKSQQGLRWLPFLIVASMGLSMTINQCTNSLQNLPAPEMSQRQPTAQSFDDTPSVGGIDANHPFDPNVQIFPGRPTQYPAAGLNPPPAKQAAQPTDAGRADDPGATSGAAPKPTPSRN